MSVKIINGRFGWARHTVFLVGRLVILLLLLDRTVVVDEDKGVLILRVCIASCTLITWTEIALQ